MAEKTHWIHDIETLSNCFVAVFEHYKRCERKVFIVHNSHNDLEKLCYFLNECVMNDQWLIGFNSISFDSQILAFILENAALWRNYFPDQITDLIYQKAKETISRQERKEFSEYPEWKIPFKQLDLFKMNHWDNPAKSSSLKWIQFAMNWPNVQEMPIHHSTCISTQQQVDTIIHYCCNDVTSTKEILIKSKDLINLRATLSKEYGINLYSASEPRISKQLFAHFLTQELDVEKWELKNLRTPREFVTVKDILVPYIQFKTEAFLKVEDWYRNLVLDFKNDGGDDEQNKKYRFSINYRGIQTDYGLGGIHGARQGMYSAGSGYIIITSDVTSFYPNLAIENGWSPAHFPPEVFCRLYKWFFTERTKIPKTDPKNYVYKIILNSTYGLSKEKNSFLYDPAFTMRITINGQLSLSMLYEMLAEGIPGAIPLMQNTDGLELMIPEKYYQRYMDICTKWERTTRLKLEHDEYSKMMIWDVNNYIAIYKNGKTKCKGRFEWEDLEKMKASVLHKNKSFLIVPKAIYNYFVNGIAPEDYLLQNRNIYDYCAGSKVRGDWYFESRKNMEGRIYSTRLQKTIRYYISNSGEKLMKCNPDGREIQLESGKWLQVLFNQFEDKSWEKYGINDLYYLNAIYKEIGELKTIQVEDILAASKYTQLELFA